MGYEKPRFGRLLLNNGEIMTKLYAHTVKNHKTILKYDFVKDEDMQWSDFFEYVREICHAMDLPTPVILKTHLFNFAKFNYTRFLPTDFVESVDFDFLMVERVKE